MFKKPKQKLSAGTGFGGREKEFKDSATSKWGWFTLCAEHHQFSGDLQSFFLYVLPRKAAL